MLQALQDRTAGAASPRQVVMVVGAGRGPLVAAALSAGERAGVELRVYAVEKNPNAVVTLRSRCRSEAAWKHVTVVSSDMREWEAPEQAKNKKSLTLPSVCQHVTLAAFPLSV